MKNHNQQQRLSQLCTALSRITASLDLQTVLREILASACMLTHARNGIITTVDESGRPEEFISTGLSPEEELLLRNNMADGLRLFEHLSQQTAPVRLDDFSSYVRSLGITTELCRCQTFLSTSIVNQGGYVGNCFLGDKQDGGGFTREDEDLLVIFASQAGSAITNARTHREEQRMRTRFETLVEVTPMGVLLFEVSQAQPPFMNLEAQRIVALLGLSNLSLPALIEKLKVPFPDGHEALLDQFSSGEPLRNAEVELAVAGERTLRMLVNVIPLRYATGKVQALMIAMQDLSPFAELDRLRVEFLSLVSHELRVPLASIKGSTSTLLDAKYRLDSNEIRQFLRIIDQGANRMQSLIGNLLDVGRIQIGKLSIDPTAVTVLSLVEQARTMFLSGEKGYTLRINLPPDLPLVMADEERIVQVLNNLLANAARHSPEPSVIEVGAVREGDAVALWVADEGRGIEPERLPSLFRRYTTGDASFGFGLGLAIAKGLVEAHGGRIKAESMGLGFGARFTFTLPMAEETVERAQARAAPASLAPASILLVEDDPQILRYVRDTLTDAGYLTLATDKLDEAAHLARTKKPQLVLLDLMLPGGDGLTFLQEEPGLADLPVIFISGYGREETIARALDAGAVDYMVKPFSSTELISRIRSALRRYDRAAPFGLGELTIDYARRLVRVGDRPIALTPTEYDLLHLLSVNAGRVLSFDSLLHKVWGNAEGADTQAVRNFVKKLRRKLGDDPASPSFILNVRGVGYRMPGPDEASRALPDAAVSGVTE